MAIGRLICGEPDHEWSAKDTFDHYTDLFNRFWAKVAAYRENIEEPDAQMFSAFCTRVILENTSSIIAGRLDPFRLLAVRGYQMHGDFDHGKPLKAGYRWSGDIISKEAIQNIWIKDVEGPQINRALFSPYSEELFWRPAYTALLSYFEEKNLSKSPLMNNIEPSLFVTRAKTKMNQLYSTLSKGVHWDYLAPTVMLDSETIATTIEDTLAYVKLLGITSHFIPTCYGRLNKEEACQIYLEL